MTQRAVSKGQALYDFKGNSDLRQLTFKVGDVINITNQYDNGWWAGELNGTIGYVPATYIKLMSDASGTLSVLVCLVWMGRSSFSHTKPPAQ